MAKKFLISCGCNETKNSTASYRVLQNISKCLRIVLMTSSLFITEVDGPLKIFNKIDITYLTF